MRKSRILTVITVLILAAAMLAATCALTGCGAEIESISLNTNGVTTEFTVGDEFTAAGLKVTAKMSDGTTADVALKDCKISNPNMTVAGEKEITVTYQEKTSKYTITVKVKNERPPLVWKEDFTVDPSGSNKIYTLSALNAALDDNGVDHPSNPLGPSDIDPENSVGGMIPGDKVIYMIGSKAAGKAKLWFNFDHSSHGGLDVNRLLKITVNGNVFATEALFANGEEGHAHVSWACYQKTLLGEVDIAEGQNTITFEFLGNGSNLKEIILDFSDGSEQPVTLTGITASTEKADFYREDAFKTDGVTVTATYSDNSTRPVALSACSFSQPDMSTSGEKTVTVTHGEKTATYKITVAASTRFVAAPTADVKKFTFNAMDAILDSSIKVEREENSIGGIAEANAPSAVFKFDSTVQGQAKLLFICSHEFADTSVDTAMDVTVNTVKKATGANFVTPQLGHDHQKDWYCFQETELYVIDVAEGLNTIEMDFKINFTNVRGIALDFDLTAPPSPVQTYRYEAESALLSNCMVEYKTGVSASGNMLVGDMGTVGAAARFTVYADAEGTADLTIKFASNAPKILGDVFDVSVGEAKLDLTGINIPSGSGARWYEWTGGTIEGIALAEGLNVITVARPANGGGSNFDYIELVTEIGLTDKAEGTTKYKFDGTAATYSEGVTPEEGHDGWLSGVVDGSTVTFTFNSDKAATGVLTFLMDHNNSTKPMANVLFDIEVNGNAYETAAQLGYCGGACPDSWHHAIACNLGEITLRADAPNTVKFTFKSGEGLAPSNFNGISIATTATLTAGAA